ncbi:hypothetical protein FQP90_23085, partial [Paenarthrobacter nitroguajacolicus]
MGTNSHRNTPTCCGKPSQKSGSCYGVIWTRFCLITLIISNIVYYLLYILILKDLTNYPL